MWSTLLTAAALAGTPTQLYQTAQTHSSLRSIPERPTVPASAYEEVTESKPVTGLEFVDGVAAGQAWGVGILKAPMEDVWASLYDIEAHPRTMGNVAESHILEREGDRRVVFQRIGLPVVSDRCLVVSQTVNTAIHEASGGALREVSAVLADRPLPDHIAPLAEGAVSVELSRSGWLLMDLGDGRTLVEYWVWADPGGRLPAGPVSRFAPGAIRNLMGKLESAALAR